MKVMGIVNVTPDSFSDGGLFFDHEKAIERGLQLVSEGADVLDIGGESTRPGADAGPLEEELRRVIPVVEGLAGAAPVSIDTTKAEVARQAIEAGAKIVNDVTALRGDPEMVGVVAETGVELVLMHMLGTPRTMQDDPRYDDVVAEVAEFLAVQAGVAEAAGVERDKIWIDPGIGFGKTVEHNLLLLRSTSRFVEMKLPVLVGASRKRFIGELGGGAPEGRRLGGTIAACLAARERGAAMVRVHDVAPVVQAILVASAIEEVGE
ncbi:MAG: dihydropteroate synthase [Solirubrobacterales bacterium]|nr:dihydropteroate synthase [Solirubrobacterales bacterium]